MEEILKDFPVRTANALELLMDYEWDDTRFYSKGEDVHAVLDGYGMVRCTVILRGTGAQPWQELTCYDRELSRDGDGYRMRAEYFDEVAEQTRELKLYFQDAEVELEVFRAESVMEKPWELLADLAMNILMKAQFGVDVLNDREMELKPLLSELKQLSRLDSRTNHHTGFPELRKLFERYGYKELERPLRKAEEACHTKKWHSRIGSLRSRLDQVKYEPLWRELYGKITESQADYPSRAEEYPGFAERKKKIEWKLHQLGYRGEYPDFVKEGEVRKLRVAESYGQSWFIWNERRAVFRIHCEESVYFDELLIWFHCGTELLKSGQEPGDIHHCRFDSRGRTILRTVDYSALAEEALEQKLTVAAKKAELRKLTREERKLDGDVNLLGLSLAILILGGGFVTLFMIAGMAVLVAAISWLLGDWSATVDMLKVLPWGQLAAFCWLGFGGCMALVTIWAKRS